MIFPNPFRFLAAMLVSAYGKLRGYKVLADVDTRCYRVTQCRACAHLEDGQCRICTCWVDAKAALNLEKCPKGKWGRVWTRRSKFNTV